ncbi:MAG: hypothetical protein JNM39_18580 [Bdellovibrionaceae bacterium]|nr:hypothetical protein [Pseudobdellovibrionaceae bacterium]
MKIFAFTIFLVSALDLNSAYGENLNYKCKVNDKSSPVPQVLEVNLLFNSQKYINLSDNKHFVIVNFYGDFLEVTIEEKVTQKVVFRSISKGPQISIGILMPAKMSLSCQL